MALRPLSLRRRYRKGGDSTPPSGTTHTGSVNATVTTVVASAAVCLFAGVISATIDTTTSIVATATATHSGIVSALVDTTTVLNGTKTGIQYGSLSVDVDTTAIPTGSITAAGATTATVDASTYVYSNVTKLGSLAITSDSSTLIDADLFKNASIGVTADATVPSILGRVERNGSLVATVDTTTNIDGYAIYAGVISATVDSSTNITPYFVYLYEQTDFRIGRAYGAVDYDGDWIAAKNTNISLDPSHTDVRIRFGIRETNNTNDSHVPTFNIRYRINGTGGWTPVSVGDVNKPVDTGYTRKQLISTATPFVRGFGGTLVSPTSSYFPDPLVDAITELEFAVSLPTLSTSDYVEFAVHDSGNLIDSYVYTPKITRIAGVPEVVDQDSFRLRNDDGSETGATWLAALNTNASLDIGKTYRVRYLLQQSSTTVNPAQLSSAYALQYKGVNSHKHYANTDITAALVGSGSVLAVAISGDGLVMAAGWEIPAYTAGHEGRVYIYDWNGTTETWDSRNSISAPKSYSGGPPYNLSFGKAVALDTDGATLVVGDPYYFNGSLNNVGEAYVYDWNGSSWSLGDTIVNPAPSASAPYFGWDVDIDDSGSHVIVLWEGKSWGEVKYYEPSGGNWSLSQTVALPQIGTTSSDASNLAISGDGTVMAIKMSPTIATYLYDRSASTWTKRTDYETIFSSGTIDLNYAGDELLCQRTLSNNIVCFDTHQDTGSNTWILKSQTLFDESLASISGYSADSDLSTIVSYNATTEKASTFKLDYNWHYVISMPFYDDEYTYAPVICTATVEVEEQEATTQLLGSGTFEAGTIATKESTQVTWNGAAATETELEFCIQLNPEYIVATDQIQLRVVKAGGFATYPFTTYTNTPTVTALEAPIVYTQYTRGRNDDGTEVTATWIASSNIGWFQKEDDIFRVRAGLTNLATLGASAAGKYKLEYNVNAEGSGYIRSPENSIEPMYPVVVDTAYSTFASDIAVSGDGKVMYVSDYRYNHLGTSNSGMIFRFTYDEATGDWVYHSFTYYARGTAYYNGHSICTNETGSILVYGISGYTAGVGRVIIATLSGTTYTARTAITVSGGESVGSSVAMSADTSRIVILYRHVSTGISRVNTYSISPAYAATLEPATIVLSDNSPLEYTDYSDVALSRDGLVLSIVDDGSWVKIYDWNSEASNWTLRNTFDAPVELERRVTATTLNEDGSLLFIAGTNQIHQTEASYAVRNNTFGSLYEYTTSWSKIGTAASSVSMDMWPLRERVTMSANGERLFHNAAGLVNGFTRRYVWTPVAAQGTSTDAIRYANSTSITDPTATTQLITTGTFNAGQVIESGDADTTWTTSGVVTEAEYVLQLDAGVATYADQYKLRVVDADGVRVAGYSKLLVIDGEYTEHPVVEQRDYRGRNDDNYEASATWITDVNTQYDSIIGSPHRLRFTLENTNQPFPAKAWPYKLQYNRNLYGTYYVGSNINSSDDDFGYSVAISTDKQVLAVGAPGVTSDQGRVTIYDWVTGAWSSRGTITTAVYSSRFGSGVDLNSDGSLLVVGSEGRTTGGHTRGGEVYLYTWGGSSWSLTETWNADWWATGETQTSAYFGSDVSINASGTQIAVGCKLYDYGGGFTQGGKIYLLRKVTSTWYNDGTVNLPVTDWQAGYGVCLNDSGTVLGFGAMMYNSYKGLIYFADYTVTSGWVLRTYGLGSTTNNERLGMSIATTRNGLVTVVGTDLGYYWVVDWDGTDTPTGTTIRESVYSGANFSHGIDITPEGDIIIVGDPGPSDGDVYTGGVTLDWTDVPPQADTVSAIKLADSVWITDGEATTQLLSSPDDFEVGTVEESGSALITWTADTSESSEIEYVIETTDAHSVNGDLYHFRILQNNGTETSDIPQTYTEIAKMYTYKGLLEGVVSVSADVSTLIGYTQEAQVSVSADCSVVIEVQTTAEVEASVDSSVTTNVTMDWAAKVSTPPDRIKTTITGRLAKRGVLDVYFGTRCFPTGSLFLNGKVTGASLSSIIASATNLVNTSLGVVVDVTTNVQGNQIHRGRTIAGVDVTTLLHGTINNEAAVHCRTDVHTFLKESLTRGAKCVIIGASNTNIEAHNYKYVALSLVSTSTVTISPTIFREASISLDSSATVSMAPLLDKSSTIEAGVNTYVVVGGDVIRPCRIDQSNIVSGTNSTNVPETTNQTNTICGESI